MKKRKKGNTNNNKDNTNYAKKRNHHVQLHTALEEEDVETAKSILATKGPLEDIAESLLTVIKYGFTLENHMLTITIIFLIINSI
jgi:hypothetical protein